MSELLEPAALAESLATLPHWTYDPDAPALRRDLVFRDFGEAFAFMSRVAVLADRAGHHPDWSNSYNRVSIALSTHDVGGISDKDIALARAIDQLGA